MSILRRASSLVEEVFPATEEVAGVYVALSGVMYSLAGICVEQTMNQIDASTVGSHPKVFAGKIAVSALAAGAGAVFTDRLWESRDK